MLVPVDIGAGPNKTEAELSEVNRGYREKLQLGAHPCI